MVAIAVIHKNRCYFEEMEKYVVPLLYSEHTKEVRAQLKEELNTYIWSILEPYVEFIETDPEFLLEQACNSITKDFPGRTPDRDFFFHTENSYSFPKSYLEFIHAQPLWTDYELAQPESMNNIGCLLSLKHHVIENACVVLANGYDTTQDQPTVLTSVTKADILRVIRRRFYFSAILIRDNRFIKYYYQSPQHLVGVIFNIGLEDNIEHTDCDLLKYKLSLYFKYTKTGTINEIATRINGSFRLFGDVLMLHELDAGVNANLSIREATRLNVLAYGRLYDRQLQPAETHTVTRVEATEDGQATEKKVTPYWSRYLVVEKRIKKWVSQGAVCINCGLRPKPQTKLRPCDRCYRVRYCSPTCETEFRSYHYNECINPASTTY